MAYLCLFRGIRTSVVKQEIKRFQLIALPCPRKRRPRATSRLVLHRHGLWQGCGGLGGGGGLGCWLCVVWGLEGSPVRQGTSVCLCTRVRARACARSAPRPPL